MTTDIQGKQVEVGDTVACLIQDPYNMLFVAEILQLHTHRATVRYKYPFDNRTGEATAYYDDMVLLQNKQWPNTLHPSHKSVRSSDASTFDFICDDCGATDSASGGWAGLSRPCNHV